MSNSEREAAVGALVAAVRALRDEPYIGYPQDEHGRMTQYSLAKFMDRREFPPMSGIASYQSTPVRHALIRPLLDALVRVEATEAKEADRA